MNKIQLLGDILFYIAYKINEVVNKLLMAGDKFMPEMHLKQPGFTFSACGAFTKNKGGNKKFIQTGNTNYIYRNDLGRACFHHDKAYGKYKYFDYKNKIR